MPETIDITPHWPNMRAFVLKTFETDPALALHVNNALGVEAAIPLRNG